MDEPLVSAATRASSEQPAAKAGSFVVKSDQPPADIESPAEPAGAVDEPLVHDLSDCSDEPCDDHAQSPQKRAPCCQKPKRREGCIFVFGFFIALLLGGIVIFIFVQLTSDASSSTKTAPLHTPQISAVVPSHPGWLSVGWADTDGVSWRVEQQHDGDIFQYIVNGRSSYVAGGLKGATKYCFRIQGFSVSQNSSWSAAVCNITVSVAPPGVSDPPDLLSMNASDLVARRPGKLKVVRMTEVTANAPQFTTYYNRPFTVGDSELSYYASIRTCASLATANGNCSDAVVVAADANNTVTLHEPARFGVVLFQAFTNNSAGPSKMSDSLVCVNTALVPIIGSPWSCSRSAPPTNPVLTVGAVSATGFTVHWKASSASSASSIVKYLFQMDDWWNHRSGVLSDIAAVDGGTTQFVMSDSSKMIAATTYQVRIGAVDSRGSTSWSPTIAVRTSGSGKCGNSADLLQQRNRNQTMKHDIQVSLLSCEFNPNRVQCATDKVAAVMQWSADCSRCWVNEGLCVQSHCLAKCLSPESQACDQCARDHCFTDLDICTGVPEWTYPP